MVVFLQKEGARRSILEITHIEAFTQKPFFELIKSSHASKHDYFLSKVKTSEGLSNCYDARQLCKYVFEMVISPKHRMIRIKNFKDPLNHQKIAEISFFRLKHDSDEKLRSEYMGNHSDFLTSNCFRNKIFYREDAMYALSVNFDFQENKKIPIFSKKQIFSLFFTIIIVLFASTILVMALEREKILKDRIRVDNKVKHIKKE